MKTCTLQLPGIFLLLFALHASATVRYVDLNSPTPTPPFTGWATAATNIQDAVDAAVNGDLVLVTNGVYQTGGVKIVMTNRLAVTKALTVQSVNGPAVTVIKGFQVPGTTNGLNAVRCVYLTNGATISGFTITNGATTAAVPGGGIFCLSTNALVINCVIVGNASLRPGAGACSGTLTNCTLADNLSTPVSGVNGGGGAASNILYNCTLTGNGSTFSGGGAVQAILFNCLIVSNTAGGAGGGGVANSALTGCVITSNTTLSSDGGGALNCTLSSCTVSNCSASNGGGIASSTISNSVISNNRASLFGGGTYNSKVYDCSIIGNTAGNGGGLANGSAVDTLISGNSGLGSGGGAFTSGGNPAMLTNCIVFNNIAKIYGGGANVVDMYNCLIVSNRADLGGGAYAGVLNSCILVGNFATNSAGGYVNSTAVKNCIIYYNTPSNYSAAAPMDFCCTTPLPGGGIGSIIYEPIFVNHLSGDFHLQSNSPCINAGNNSSVTTSSDLDNNPRIAGGTADIGAYEFQSPSSTLSYAWAQQYALPTDGSADSTDEDTDGLNNWQEWIAGTVPTNSLSVLTLFSPSNNAPGLKVSWQSVSGKTYFLQRSTNLLAQPAFSSIKSNLAGAATTTVYTDLTATNSVPYFYRVGVQ